jgi:hypothetical protein
VVLAPGGQVRPQPGLPALGEVAEVVGQRVDDDHIQRQRYPKAQQPATCEPAGPLAGQGGGRERPAEQEQGSQREHSAQQPGQANQRRPQLGGGALGVVPVGVDEIRHGGVDDDDPGDDGDLEVVHPRQAPSSRCRRGRRGATDKVALGLHHARSSSWMLHPQPQLGQGRWTLGVRSSGLVAADTPVHGGRRPWRVSWFRPAPLSSPAAAWLPPPRADARRRRPAARRRAGVPGRQPRCQRDAAWPRS